MHAAAFVRPNRKENAKGRERIAIRLRGLDALRGVAIVGMVAAHTITTFWDSPQEPLFRALVFCWPAPLFTVVAGSLIGGRAPSRKAFTRLLLATVATFLVTRPLAYMPMVLPVFLACYVLWTATIRRPMVAAFVALVWAMSAASFPSPEWTYQPGAMYLGLIAGAHVGPRAVARYGERLRAFELVGRYPLTVYVGHLAILSLLVWAGIGQGW